MSATSGRASAQGTAAFARRHGRDGSAYRVLGSTGLTASGIGLGTMRLSDTSVEYHEAFVNAVALGCNLIDTASIFGHGASELAVGKGLSEVFTSGTASRDELIVISKLGPISTPRFRQLFGDSDTAGIVKCTSDLWFSVQPDHLRQQLDATLARLRLSTLDGCLLHLPEYYLTDAHERSWLTVEERRRELIAQLETAFRYLESEVSQGRIGFYGLASETMAASAADPSFVCLESVLKAAEAVAGASHNFRLIEFPFNLLEARPLLYRGAAGSGRTVIETAVAGRLGVIAYRVLSPRGFGDGRGMRLSAISVPVQEVDFKAQFERVEALEQEYQSVLVPRILMSVLSADVHQFFRLASLVASVLGSGIGPNRWARIKRVGMASQLALQVDIMNSCFRGATAWVRWRDRYLAEYDKLQREGGRLLMTRWREESLAVEALVNPHIPSGRRQESLSRKALWVAVSTPGITSVLCGMRRRGYVRDALGVLGWPTLPDVTDIWLAIADRASW